MDVFQPVIVAVLATAAVAVFALFIYRPWKHTQRLVRGHEVTFHVETDLRRMDIPAGVEAPWTFWIPGEPTPPEGPMWGNADWMEWARSLGGHDVRTSVVQVTIQGIGDGPVSIDPPELVNHRAVEPSADGAVYGPEGLGGNGIHSRRFIFELDGERSTRQYLDDPEERPGSFSIAKGETQRMLVVVHVTDQRRHLWAVDIPVIYAGRRRLLQVRGPDNSAFTTYGGRGLPVQMLVDGRWFKSPPSPF